MLAGERECSAGDSAAAAGEPERFGKGLLKNQFAQFISGVRLVLAIDVESRVVELEESDIQEQLPLLRRTEDRPGTVLLEIDISHADVEGIAGGRRGGAFCVYEGGLLIKMIAGGGSDEKTEGEAHLLRSDEVNLLFQLLDVDEADQAGLLLLVLDFFYIL